MSLTSLDIARFKEWTIQQLYYLLYPYIKEDFMGRSDCRLVHTEGNMTVIISGVTGNVNHVIRGGSDNLASAKEAEYRVYVEEGQVVIDTAESTGEFTGRAR